MATSPHPPLVIPKSALKHYIPVKLIGKGKDGMVYLALPNTKGTVKSEDPTVPLKQDLVALKIVGDLSSCLTGKIIDLIKLQRADIHRFGSKVREGESIEAKRKISKVHVAPRDPWEEDEPSIWEESLRKDDIPGDFVPKLVPIRKYIEGRVHWYAMDVIPGISVDQLLKKYKAPLLDENNKLIVGKDNRPLTYNKPLSAWLICHIFVEVCQIQRWLFNQGQCHLDLAVGGNVVLRSDKETGGLPAITLIDHGGIFPYQGKPAACLAFHQVLNLIHRSMRYQLGDLPLSGGCSTASSSDVALARRFFEALDTYGRKAMIEGDNEDRWEQLKPLEFWEEWGAAAKELRSSLRTPECLGSLREKLTNELISESELRSTVEAGGLRVKILPFE